MLAHLRRICSWRDAGLCNLRKELSEHMCATAGRSLPFVRCLIVRAFLSASYDEFDVRKLSKRDNSAHLIMPSALIKYVERRRATSSYAFSLKQ